MNKYEKMEIVSFEDIDDLYNSIGIELMNLDSTDDHDYITVYGKRDIMVELFEMMIGDGYTFGYADFDAMDELRKDDIYMMFIRANCVISVEPAIGSNGKPMGHDAKAVLISMEDCKQNVIDYCVNRGMEVTLFDFDVDDECCGCCECTCKEGTKPTTSANQNFYVNGKPVTKEEFDKKYEEFENKYMDNIRDMLLSYCEFMDEMNEWSKLFRW